LASKYDSYWRELLPKIKALLDEAKERGVSREIDVSGLAKIGRRRSWNGRVDVSNSIVKSDMAHTTSLGNVLINSGILKSYGNSVFRLSVSNALKLRARFPGQADLTLGLKKKFPQPREALTEEALETEDFGILYGLIRDFELDVRHFIIEMLGKKWLKRLENAVPKVVEGWRDRYRKDKKWKMNLEENLINYADIPDYMQIVRKYRKLFTDSDEELEEVMTFFKMLANMGRNPIMHFRTITKEGYYGTKLAEFRLRNWMEKTQRRRLSSNNSS